MNFDLLQRFSFICRRALLIGLLTGIVLPCRAWDADAHEIVAIIAFEHLNPKAKAEVAALVSQVAGAGKNYDPVTIACWMDDLRGHDSEMPYHGQFLAWHYVDLGIDPNDPSPVLEPGRDNATSGNVVTALKRVLVVLKGGTDPYVQSKAMALAMAEHLVGDIHQPLHAATYYYSGGNGRWNHDAGGNRVVVVNGPEFERSFTLHHFWDSAWRATFDGVSGRVVIDGTEEDRGHRDQQAMQAVATEMEAAFKPSAETKLEPDFEAWARESNQIARDSVYPKLTFTENHKLARISAEYVAMAGPLARQRLVLAGLRLAVLLNATLGVD